jgi:hypothetical protein
MRFRWRERGGGARLGDACQKRIVSWIDLHCEHG